MQVCSLASRGGPDPLEHKIIFISSKASTDFLWPPRTSDGSHATVEPSDAGDQGASGQERSPHNQKTTCDTRPVEEDQTGVGAEGDGSR